MFELYVNSEAIQRLMRESDVTLARPAAPDDTTTESNTTAHSHASHPHLHRLRNQLGLHSHA